MVARDGRRRAVRQFSQKATPCVAITPTSSVLLELFQTRGTRTGHFKRESRRRVGIGLEPEGVNTALCSAPQRQTQYTAAAADRADRCRAMRLVKSSWHGPLLSAEDVVAEAQKKASPNVHLLISAMLLSLERKINARYFTSCEQLCMWVSLSIATKMAYSWNLGVRVQPSTPLPRSPIIAIKNHGWCCGHPSLNN